MLAGMAALALLGSPLDALAMGEDEARGLGVPVAALRFGAIALATLVSALSVSLSGMIGWIGLFAPHFARLLVGPGNVRLLPASALVGAIFLIGADTLARSVARAEIPIGIVTELLGIPAFVLGAASRAKELDEIFGARLEARGLIFARKGNRLVLDGASLGFGAGRDRFAARRQWVRQDHAAAADAGFPEARGGRGFARRPES